MDNQIYNMVVFAGFSGFVGGVVLTWIVARMVLSGRPEIIREQLGKQDIAHLRRLADGQARHAQTLAEANKLAQSAASDIAKVADLLRQAEGAARTNTDQLSGMANAAAGPTILESEPLRPRAARAARA